MLVVASLVAVGVVLTGLTWATEKREGNTRQSRVYWAVSWSLQGLFQESKNKMRVENRSKKKYHHLKEQTQKQFMEKAQS